MINKDFSICTENIFNEFFTKTNEFDDFFSKTAEMNEKDDKAI